MERIPLEDKLSTEYFRAVGVLMTTAAWSEYSLVHLLVRIKSEGRESNVPDYFVLLGMNTKAKIETIKSILRMRFAADISQIKKTISVCDKIYKQFEHRNEIAHMPGIIGDKADRITLVDMRVKPDGSLAKPKVYNANQILQFARVMRHRVAQLDQCLNELGFPPVERRPNN